MTRLQQLIESKAAYRRQLARLPIAEKLRIVEALAERTLAIRASRSNAKPKPRETPKPKD